MAAAYIIFFVGIALVLIGLLLVILAFLLRSTRTGGKANVQAGGVVIIGPIPIVFGTDKKAVKTVLILAIVLTALVLVVTILNYLLSG